MASVCYTWTNSPFSWDNARLSWADFCIIQTVLTSRTGSALAKNKAWRKRHELEKIEEEEENDQSEEEIQKIEDLTEVEKKAFINLIVSMENKESKILEEITKKKNSDIIIDIKDIEIKKTKSNQISIKINFDEI
jgi:hypothetical protein